MLAGQFTAPHRIDLVEVPEPTLALAGSGEIIFQPELTCLCGSDTPYFVWSGEWPIELGHSLHEMIGRVVATNGTGGIQCDRCDCPRVDAARSAASRAARDRVGEDAAVLSSSDEGRCSAAS